MNWGFDLLLRGVFLIILTFVYVSFIGRKTFSKCYISSRPFKNTHYYTRQQFSSIDERRKNFWTRHFYLDRRKSVYVCKRNDTRQFTVVRRVGRTSKSDGKNKQRLSFVRRWDEMKFRLNILRINVFRSKRCCSTSRPFSF